MCVKVKLVVSMNKHSNVKKCTITVGTTFVVITFEKDISFFLIMTSPKIKLKLWMGRKTCEMRQITKLQKY